MRLATAFLPVEAIFADDLDLQVLPEVVLKPIKGGKFKNAQNKDDLPRERLMKSGAKSLTDAELLAILLGTGLPGTNVVELAKLILAKFDNKIGNVARASVVELTQIRGLGPAKAITIITALELGVRRMNQVNDLLTLTSAEEVAAFMIPQMIDLTTEHLFAIFLNNANKVISVQLIGIGSATNVIFDVRSVMKSALQYNASKLIVSHNHPSYNLKVSPQDLNVTKQLVDACHLLGLKLLDHIIIGGTKFVSMAESPETSGLFVTS